MTLELIRAEGNVPHHIKTHDFTLPLPPLTPEQKIHALRIRIRDLKRASPPITLNDLLYLAFKQRDAEAILYFLEQGAEIPPTAIPQPTRHPNTFSTTLLQFSKTGSMPEDPEGETLLTWAAKEGHFPLLKVLLEKGANIWQTNGIGLTALELADAHGYISISLEEEITKASILEGELDIPVPLEDAAFASEDETTKPGRGLRRDSLFSPLNSKNYTARPLKTSRDFLDHALREVSILKDERYVAVIALLLWHGYTPADPHGDTLLPWAAKKGLLFVMETLFAQGARLWRTKGMGFSALKGASGRLVNGENINGHIAIVALLLHQNRTPEDPNDETLLSWAAKEGAWLVVKTLLEKMPDVWGANGAGFTALQGANDNSYAPIIELLVPHGLRHGCTPQDPKGDRLFMWAVEKGLLLVIEVLLENIRLPWGEKEMGPQALQLANTHGHKPVIDRLLRQELDQGGIPGDQLIWAAHKGLVHVVEVLLAKRMSIWDKNEVGLKAWKYAHRKGDAPVMELLLCHKLHHGWTPDDPNLLTWAAENGCVLAVEALLAKMTPVIWAGEAEPGFVAWELAKKKGHESVMALLLSHRLHHGWMPDHAGGSALLIWAVAKGYVSTVEALLAKMTPLIWDEKGIGFAAALQWENADVPVIDRLLQHGLQHGRGNLLLMWAAEEGHVSIIKALLAKKVPLWSEYGVGLAALQLANKNDHKPIIKLLLRHKSTPAAPERGTLLMWAAEQGYALVVEALLAKMTSRLWDENGLGVTALQLAEEQGHGPVMELLLHHRLYYGWMPEGAGGGDLLIWAAEQGHMLVVEALVEKMEAIWDENGVGFTALQLAEKNNHKSIAELLWCYMTEVVESKEDMPPTLRNDANPEPKSQNAAQPAEEIPGLPIGERLENKEEDICQRLAETQPDAVLSGLQIEIRYREQVRNGCTPTERKEEEIKGLRIQKHYLEIIFPLSLTPEDRLYLAFQQRDPGGVAYFLKQGANIPPTAIPDALDSDELSTMSMQFSKTGYVPKDPEGDTLFTWAAREGHLSLVEDLLVKGVHSGHPNRAGFTALQLAHQNQHMHVLDLILRHMCPLDDKRDGNHRAAEEVKVPLEEKENVLPPESRHPLVAARSLPDRSAGAQQRCISARSEGSGVFFPAFLRLQKGIVLHVYPEPPESSLECSASMEKESQHDALDIEKRELQTEIRYHEQACGPGLSLNDLLYIAFRRGEVEHLTYFLEQIPLGALPLTIQTDNFAVLSFFRRQHGDVGLRDDFEHNGDTPLIWAVRNDYPQLVKLLLAKGVDMLQKNCRGQTALGLVYDWACEGCDPDKTLILELLLEHREKLCLNISDSEDENLESDSEDEKAEAEETSWRKEGAGVASPAESKENIYNLSPDLYTPFRDLPPRDPSERSVDPLPKALGAPSSVEPTPESDGENAAKSLTPPKLVPLGPLRSNGYVIPIVLPTPIVQPAPPSHGIVNSLRRAYAHVRTRTADIDTVDPSLAPQSSSRHFLEAFRQRYAAASSSSSSRTTDTEPDVQPSPISSMRRRLEPISTSLRSFRSRKSSDNTSPPPRTAGTGTDPSPQSSATQSPVGQVSFSFSTTDREPDVQPSPISSMRRRLEPISTSLRSFRSRKSSDNTSPPLQQSVAQPAAGQAEGQAEPSSSLLNPLRRAYAYAHVRTYSSSSSPPRTPHTRTGTGTGTDPSPQSSAASSPAGQQAAFSFHRFFLNPLRKRSAHHARTSSYSSPGTGTGTGTGTEPSPQLPASELSAEQPDLQLGLPPPEICVNAPSPMRISSMQVGAAPPPSVNSVFHLLGQYAAAERVIDISSQEADAAVDQKTDIDPFQAP